MMNAKVYFASDSMSIAIRLTALHYREITGYSTQYEHERASEWFLNAAEPLAGAFVLV